MTTKFNGQPVTLAPATSSDPAAYGFGAPYQASDYFLAPEVTSAVFETNDKLHLRVGNMNGASATINNLAPALDSNNAPIWLGITGNVGNDNLTINSTLAATNMPVYGAVVVDGGNGIGNDTLNVTVAENRDVRMLGGDGNDTYNLNLNTLNHTLASAKPTHAELYDTTGNDTYNITMNGRGSVNVNDHTGTNTLNITGSNTAVSGGNQGFTAVLGDGADTVRLTSVSGGGTEFQQNFVATGLGNDTVYVNSALANTTGNVLLDGQEGTDILSFANATSQAHIEHGGRSFLKATSEVGFLDIGFETINGSGFDDEFFNKTTDNVTVNLGNGNDYAYGNAGSETLNGGAGNDVLVGYAGDDKLNGGAGSDTMDGGLGNDTFYVDDAQDLIVEQLNAGTDSVVLSGAVRDIKLGDGMFANVENVTANALGSNVYSTSAAANRFSGGVGNDTFTDVGGGNDIMNGGAGADRMSGGIGNDSYYVDSNDDVVTELAGQGADTVYLSTPTAGYQYTLAQNVENVVASANGNVIKGNDLANSIYGGAGFDQMTGGAGADTFRTTQGGAWGVNANGVKVYTSGLSNDLITDFQSGVDKINLANFDAKDSVAGVDHFTFIGSAQFTGEGQLRYVDGCLFGNTGGDLGVDFTLKLTGNPPVVASDLVL